MSEKLSVTVGLLFTPGVSTDPVLVCVRKEELWELYADDMRILAETEEELQRRVVEWQEALEWKGVNAKKAEVIFIKMHGK